MKPKHLALLLGCLFSAMLAQAQATLTNAAPNVTVNFSNSMQPSVGSSPSTAYTGAGFSPNPTQAGRMNSNAWEIKGWSYGDMLFGGTQTVDDYARGSVTVGVVTPGMYVFTDLPATTANPTLLIQPGAGDFRPGTITLRIRNGGTAPITQLAIDYNLFVRNDENTSSSFNFSHSADNTAFTAVPVLDYTSPDVADAFQWSAVGTAPSRAAVLNVNLAAGDYYYIRWSSNLVSGTGESDEFGLDDIHINATYGAPAPEINVLSYGNNLLSGDTSPSVSKGTEFSTSYSPTSTVLTTNIISYYIQNPGGLPLTVSNVVITGAHASDFTVGTPSPLGVIPAASVTISQKELKIIFDPSDEGLRTARVNIYSDDADENPYWFDIQGYGVIPIPDIRINGATPGPGTSIVTHNSAIPSLGNNTLFSTQTVGGAGETKGFAIRNDCPYNAPVILTDPSPFINIGGANPADFTLVTIPTNGTINPGFVRNFSIKFAPTGTGIRTAIVTIPNNDPDEAPFTFLIQGTGIAPEIDVLGNGQSIATGSTVTSFTNHTFFDYLNVTTGTLDRTYTVLNTGNAPLTLGALTLTGTNPGDFSIITTPAASVAAAGSTTFTIRFDPTTTGLRSAIVNLVNNDPNENPYTFVVSGYGIDYVPCSFGTPDTLGSQDFEATPATPVWTYSTTGTPSVTGGNAFAATADSGASARFLGARSLQVINGSASVTFSNINTATYDDVELSLRLASLSVNATDGADNTDRVTIAISTNGGTTWSNEIEIAGNTDAKWSFVSGTGTAAAIYDGNNLATSFVAGATGFLTNNGYSTISLSGLPKSTTFAMRVTLVNNSANEIWALDNVKLFGRRYLSTTWNGGGWTPSAPAANIKSIIAGNYNTATNGNLIGCQCQINAGSTVTIGTNNYMDIQSEILNSGTLNVENGGSIVQRNDLAVNTGPVTVKRFTTAMRLYDYTYWSSPVAGQTLYNLSPNTLWDKYFSFNQTTGLWQVIPNGAAVMAPGKGYIIRAPQSFTSTPQAYTAGQFIGVPNNGIIQTPIVIGASDMNLLGNPYPSAISANAFLGNVANVGTVEGTIYLWTHNTPITALAYTANDYAVYNFSGSVGTRPAINSGVSNTSPTGFIASGQGFFIKGLSNGQATFNNSMRVTGTNMDFFRPGLTAQNDRSTESHDNAVGVDKSRVWLNLTNTQDAFKQILVGYIDGATNAYDRGFDGEAYNANSYVNFYSILDDVNLAINGRALPFDDTDQVPLGFSSTMGGLFTIGIENTDGLLSERNIYLEDKLLNVIHDLKNSAYQFETATGTFNTRFVLRFDNETLASNAFATAGNAVIVTSKDKVVSVLSQELPIKSVTVYDLLGREIHSNLNVGQKQYSVNMARTAQQTLIVKTVLENGSVVSKKVML